MEKEAFPCQDLMFWPPRTPERECVSEDIRSRIAYPDPEFCGNEYEISGGCDDYSWDGQCTRGPFERIPARELRLEARERAIRILRDRSRQAGPDAEVEDVIRVLTGQGIDPLVATSVAVDLCDGRLHL